MHQPKRFTWDLLLADDAINDRVEKNSTDSNGAPEELDGVEGLSENHGNAYDNNAALGGVGNGLGDSGGLR